MVDMVIMNQTPTRRTVLFGTSLAAALVLTVLVLTGGRKPAPPLVAAPTGEAPLPMLEGVNQPGASEQAPKNDTETSGTTGKPEAPLHN